MCFIGTKKKSKKKVAFEKIFIGAFSKKGKKRRNLKILQNDKSK